MTVALEGVSGQQHSPAALYPRERPGTHFKGGWVVPGPVWTGGKSHRHRDSIPDRPARSSVAIPTELPDALCFHRIKIKFTLEQAAHAQRGSRDTTLLFL